MLGGYDNTVELPLEKKLHFYEAGTYDIDQTKPRLEQNHAWPMKRGGTALDFGCGLGRTANALANRMGFDKVLCVDQSQNLLDKGKQALTELAGKGVVMHDASKRISFIQSQPEDFGCKVTDNSVDFVFSILTLQNMKPQMQVMYIEQICDALKPDGTGYIGIPVNSTVNDKRFHCGLNQDDAGKMLHYTEEEEIVRHFNIRGCTVLNIHKRHDTGTGANSKGFVIRK
jgi:ubiquinone/menaquinone biosynthesis C-methylase UbiE